MSLVTIPDTLWRAEQLHMPVALANALEAELTSRNVFDESRGPSPRDKELYGGGGIIETIKHFTHRFKTSSARVQFVTLDPNKSFKPHAADLRSCLLDGKVTLLDVACGSGGGLFGLLATIAELRATGRTAPLPLDLGVLAGDCSEEARLIHGSMFDRLRPHLESVGMRVRADYAQWDATKPFSTTTLMNRWFELYPDSEMYVVFVSAFSGFMAKNANPVLEAVRDIGKRIHDKPFHVAWIEPKTNDSERVLPQVWEALAHLFGLSVRGKGAEPSEEFSYVHPHTPEVITGRARLLPWERLAR